MRACSLRRLWRATLAICVDKTDQGPEVSFILGQVEALGGLQKLVSRIGGDMSRKAYHDLFILHIGA